MKIRLSGIVAVLVTFLGGLFLTAQPALAIATCQITISGSTLNPSFSANTIGENNSHQTYNGLSSWIPFDVPLTIQLTFQDPDWNSCSQGTNDGSCDCSGSYDQTDGVHYVQLEAIRTFQAIDEAVPDRTLRNWALNTADGSCASRTVTINQTFTVNDFEWDNNPFDAGSIDISLKDRDDDTLCSFRFDVNSNDFYAAHRLTTQCEASVPCTDSNGNEGVQSCIGRQVTAEDGSFSCDTSDGTLGPEETRCNQCNVCANAEYCYPGCQADDPSNTLTYSAVCANYVADCGNNICEAGEGLRSLGTGGAAVVCTEDCGAPFNAFSLCEQVPDTTVVHGINITQSQRAQCEACSLDGGLWTAVGCIGLRPETIIQAAIRIGLSISGGAAVLMMLAAGFTFSISQGDPKRTSSAKEMMTSAVIGLFFVIFSVTILQFIGVSIFRLPGFGG